MLAKLSEFIDMSCRQKYEISVDYCCAYPCFHERLKFASMIGSKNSHNPPHFLKLCNLKCQIQP